MPEVKLTRNDKNPFPYSNLKDKLGLRSKLGGKPSWINKDNTPVCPECHKKMCFYGQLDSLNDKFTIGDGGLIYVFYCFNDGAVKAVTQSS